MTSEERIEALERDLAQLRAALADTIPLLEGRQHALAILVAQIAAIIPDSDLAIRQLIETAEVSTLYSNLSDKVRETSAAEMQSIFAVLRALRHDRLDAELHRISDS